MVATELPRVVIAAPASGHGKTTVATGLMAALAGRGHDGIRPQGGARLHRPRLPRPGHRAAGPQPGPVPGRRAPRRPAAAARRTIGRHRGDRRRDGAVRRPAGYGRGSIHRARCRADGVPGAAGRGHLARVADPGGRDRRIGGVRPEGPHRRRDSQQGGQRAACRRGCQALAPTGIPVLGVLPRDDGVETPSRHLGLVPAAERSESAHTSGGWRKSIAAHVDIEAGRAHCSRMPRRWPRWRGIRHRTSAPPTATRPVVAMAGGRAFTFRYAETEELLRAAGCDVVEFDPLADSALPAGTAGIYLGGGFPEVHAAELAENRCLMAELRSAGAAGIPTVAECAGLLYLCRSLDGTPMVGAVPADAAMTPRLTLGYRTATSPGDSVLTERGSRSPATNSTAPQSLPSNWTATRRGSYPRAPKASPPRRCTPPTCIHTGPATPLWRSGSPTPSTGHRWGGSQSTASSTPETTGTPDGTAGRRTMTTGIPNSSAACIFGQV